ncbi:hypothetical protein SKAU_G00160000 [Synaphobranchus kaupii]|uniref:Serine protease n=1 Tax=Synaphobranchus kaupii TaxID=118154 RepID=A0A9Q1IZP0_SYNKA|nr:hypothetical protein SKAU_G00160000 [Synaphobranchus kaupii]
MVQDKDLPYLWNSLLHYIKQDPKAIAFLYLNKIRNLKEYSNCISEKGFDHTGYIVTRKKISQCFYVGDRCFLTTFHSTGIDYELMFAFFPSKDDILIYKINTRPVSYCDKIDYALFELPRGDVVPWERGLFDQITGDPKHDKVVHFNTYRKLEQVHSIDANVIEPHAKMKNALNGFEFLIDKFGIPGDSGAPVFSQSNRIVGMYRGDIWLSEHCSSGKILHSGRCINIKHIIKDIIKKTPIANPCLEFLCNVLTILCGCFCSNQAATHLVLLMTIKKKY